MKHTPGPWRYIWNNKAFGSNNYSIWANTPYQITHVSESKEIQIGNVSLRNHYGHVWQFPLNEAGEMIADKSFNVSELPAEANLKLMVKSPELLEQLKKTYALLVRIWPENLPAAELNYLSLDNDALIKEITE